MASEIAAIEHVLFSGKFFDDSSLEMGVSRLYKHSTHTNTTHIAWTDEKVRILIEMLQKQDKLCNMCSGDYHNKNKRKEMFMKIGQEVLSDRYTGVGLLCFCWQAYARE